MPPKLDRCVKRVQRKIKPRKKGQSKRSAAFAVCTKAIKKGKR